MNKMMRCKMMISKLSLIIINKSKTKMILKQTVLRKNVFKSKKRSLLGYDSVLPITYDLSQNNCSIPIKTINLSHDFDSNDTTMQYKRNPEIFITDMSEP